MQIYLLRHGIAEDRAASGRDQDRALTAEGKKKLKAVLEVAAGAGVAPSIILTSPYRRALETARMAADILGYEDQLGESAALTPESSPEDAWQEIRLHRDARALLCAGHEPLFSALAAYLLGAPEVLIDMKKGALVRIDIGSFGSVPRGGVLQWMLTAKLARAED
jgi:phosphohistidine phosphatase